MKRHKGEVTFVLYWVIQGTRDKGQGTSDIGLRTCYQGQRTKDIGLRTRI